MFCILTWSHDDDGIYVIVSNPICNFQAVVHMRWCAIYYKTVKQRDPYIPKLYSGHVLEIFLLHKQAKICNINYFISGRPEVVTHLLSVIHVTCILLRLMFILVIVMYYLIAWRTYSWRNSSNRKNVVIISWIVSFADLLRYIVKESYRI